MSSVILFVSIVLAVWSGLNAYVLWRISSVPFVAEHVPRWLLITAGVACWASFILGRFSSRLGLSSLSYVLDLVGANWVGILFLLFVCVLAVDIVTGFGFFLKPMAPKLRSWALLAGLLLSLIAFVQALRAPVIRDYEVRLHGLPADADGMVIAAVADTHVGTIPGKRWLAGRVAQVESLKPDIVLVLGDVVEGDSRLDRQRDLIPVLGRLSAPLGVWAVTGNHEHYAGMDAAVRLFEEAGFRVLRNEWCEVRPGLVLAGVDDGDGHGRNPERSRRVARALADRPAGVPTIFLTHRIVDLHEFENAGVGLCLSGHTHGGQIWPFGCVVGSMNPVVAGRRDSAGTVFIVSRGTGTWGPRMRLWRRGEILRIILRSSPAGPPPDPPAGPAPLPHAPGGV
ncbi:MAG: metallophosphoesterase [Planctomycetes bacterium]|nr:metallophosphoesterase [Planctomycetota bacterium]